MLIDVAQNSQMCCVVNVLEGHVWVSIMKSKHSNAKCFVVPATETAFAVGLLNMKRSIEATPSCF